MAKEVQGKATNVKWEMALAQVDKLIGQSNGALYDRAAILVKVWDDPEFLAFHKGVVDEAEKHLTSKLGDYGLTFFNVVEMLKVYPSKTSWEGGNLREMLATALNQADEDRKKMSPARTIKNRPVARSEYERVESELRKVSGQLTAVTSQRETVIQENARLRAENASLRNQLESSQIRIQELEQSLAGEFAHT